MPLLNTVRSTRARAEQWQQRHYKAIASAYAAGVNRAAIAEAAGLTRDAVYKIARRVVAADTRDDYEGGLATVETDATPGTAKDIALAVLRGHIGVSTGGRLGTEITTGTAAAQKLAAELREHGYTAVVS